MCSRDIRSFETVGGEGFLDLQQEVLKIQHQSSVLLDAKDLFPDPTTVSRNTRKMADQEKMVCVIL